MIVMNSGDSRIEETPKMMAPNSRVKSHLVIISTTAFLLFISIIQVGAQYDNHQGGHEMSAGYSGGGYSGDDERPKVHLGIKLRIPAIKFELPRFSLPKITVSAKIRQPDRPRTITLPEINLDTSSKVAAPEAADHPGQSGYGGEGGGGGGTSYGGYSSSSQYHPSHNNYGGGQEKASMFTFSTEQVSPPTGGGYSSSGGGGYSGNGGGGGGYGMRYNQVSSGGYHRQQQQSYHHRHPQQQQQQAYSATNVHPSYLMNVNDHSDHHQHNDQQQLVPFNYQLSPVGPASPPTPVQSSTMATTTSSSSSNTEASRSHELGFYAPAYTELHRIVREMPSQVYNEKNYMIRMRQ